MADLTPTQKADRLVECLKIGHTEQLQEFCQHLDDGWDINQPSSNNEYPLLIAAQKGLMNLCLWIMEEHNPDITVQNHWNINLLHIAALKGMDELFEKAFQTGKIDIDCRDKSECTPLINAATKGHKDLCDKIIQLGGSVNVYDQNGCSVLTSAIRSGNVELCQLLLDHGAKVVKFRDKEENPLEIAYAQDTVNYDIIRNLLRHGTDIGNVPPGWIERQRYELLSEISRDIFEKPLTEEILFTDGKPSKSVLNACAIGSFIELIGEPLARTDMPLFQKLFKALPPAVRQNYITFPVVAAKIAKETDGIDLEKGGQQHGG